MFKKAFIFSITILIFHFSFAQDFSNKGKDFWVAYTGHIDGTTSRMALYITSDQNASGVVDINGNSVAFTVIANQVTTVRLTNTSTPNNSLAYNGQIEGIGSKKGIHITSDKPVVVYSHILNSARSGSTLVIPTNVLGKEYYVSTYKSNGTNQVRRCQLAVVATLDNTTVEITPTNADANGLHPANVPFTVSLSKGDVYQYQSNEDLTGSHIKSIGTATTSCQPVAVFSGSTWTAMGCVSGTSGDNLYQQIFPFASWGKTYYTAPFKNRGYDIFRVLVQDPSTVVSVNGTPLSPATLINNRFYEFNTQGNNTSKIITSDKPICVFQYMITMSCDGSNVSDPEMVILNAVEQTLNDITVMSARKDLTPPNTNIDFHYLNIVFKSNTFNSLKIDGTTPASAPIPIPGTNYSYIQEDVTASTGINPAHRIVSDSGFICIAYGYGNVESYGYNAGTNVKDLYQFVTLQNQYATVNFPATCKNTPFHFSITLPYKATSLTWDFNVNPNLSPNNNVVNNTPVPDSSFVRDGRTLYVYNLAGNYSFSAIGTYPVKVIANNPTADGCSGIQEINYDVSVFDKPQADFKFNYSGCVSDTVSLLDATSAQGRQTIKWNWDFGDNTTDTLKNPLKVFTAAGIYIIKFTSVTDIGCIADTVKAIEITPKPNAKYLAPLNSCIGNTVTFTDSSYVQSATIVKWYWNFGNGNTVVNTANIPVTQVYNIAGIYTVTLQVETSSGCKSVMFNKQLTVRPNPVIDFTMPGVCLPSGIAQFTNLSSVNDGSGNNMTYLWNFGDGGTDTAKNPVHVYTIAGPFNVNLQATSFYGCIKDSIKTFSNIFAQPKANFTAPPVVCITDSVRYVDGSAAAGNSVAQWFWNFGDGSTSNFQNPTKKYATGGSFQVTLFIKSAAGCTSDTVKKSIIVNQLPSANFGFTAPRCEQQSITFTDSSKANSGTLTKLTWNFGDGKDTIVTNSNPVTHTYLGTGTYVVSLVAEASTGCKNDTVKKNIVISPLPVVDFILPKVCLSDAFAPFTDSSYIADGSESGFTYAWNFGDANANASNPNTSFLKNPVHKYSAAGIYPVSLTVTSFNGCSTTLVKSFTVNGSIPKAGFNVLNYEALCSNVKVDIENTSGVDFGSITKLEIIWDLVNAPTVTQTDNSPFLNKILSHQYPALQVKSNYQIKVKAYSGGSCVDEITKNIEVFPSPKVTFTAMPGICQEADTRQIIEASGGAVVGNGVFTGNGVSPDGIFNPTLAGAGTFPIKYVYTAYAAGCKDSATQNVTVWPSPKANWGFSQPSCEGNAITFTDSSAANFGKIIQWNWLFDDGTSANNANSNSFTKTYAVTGNYFPSLQVITDSGCRSRPEGKILIAHPLPSVEFTMPAIVCLPDGMSTFKDISGIADGTQSQFSFRWNFGDPNDTTSLTTKNATHRYSSTGPFTVKLTVTSVDGCSTTGTKIFSNVNPQPKANFAINPSEVCLGGTFSFADQSISTTSNITNWSWKFGDGATSSLQNTARRYAADGTYSVSLFITNQQGCVSDTIIKPVTVHPYPVVNAGPDLVVLEGGSVLIVPTASGNNLTYRWTPAQYLNNDSILKPTSSPLVDVTYKLTVTGRGGCQSSDEVFVKILKAPGIPNAFSPNNDGINDMWVIQYLESYPGATVEVYDRYGLVVYNSVGYNKTWDGTFKGKPLPVGVYYYIINPKNGRKQMTGSLTILR